jgi:hypothetical protein
MGHQSWRNSMDVSGHLYNSERLSLETWRETSNRIA